MSFAFSTQTLRWSLEKQPLRAALKVENWTRMLAMTGRKMRALLPVKNPTGFADESESGSLFEQSGDPALRNRCSILAAANLAGKG